MSNPTETGKAETERQEEAAEQQPRAANSDGCVWRLGGFISFIAGIIFLSPILSVGSITISSDDSPKLILLGFGLVLAGIVAMIFGRSSQFLRFFWW